MLGELVILLFFFGSINTNEVGQLENEKILENFIKDETQTYNSVLRRMDLNGQPFATFVSQMNPNELKNILSHFQYHEDSLQKTNEPRFEQNVGFGGPPHPSEKRMVFRNLTIYVNKVINHAQLQLEQNAQRIWANNPPQVIDKIPHTPIIFTLKYIEGASSLGTNGTSWGIHYFDEVYLSTRYRFDKIKYYYDVQIRPFNLVGVRKSLTVILEDAPATMNFSFEKNYSKIPRFEFINPEVNIDFGVHRWANYAINYLINEKYPKIKKKLVKIINRDTLLMLNDQLKNAQ